MNNTMMTSFFSPLMNINQKTSTEAAASLDGTTTATDTDTHSINNNDDDDDVDDAFRDGGRYSLVAWWCIGGLSRVCILAIFAA
jgi:hypothetical protein